MQKNNHIYLIAILLLMLLGCKEQKNQTNNQAIIISADLDKMDEISIHDIFDKIEIISLETTDESLINTCHKVICHNGKYYIFDYRSSKIFVFDDKGSFLWKIDDKGQGPEQYLHIADFDINRSKNNLVFVTPMNAALHEYSLDGRFLHKQKLPDILFNCSGMKFINSDTIAFWTFDYQNRLKLYSADSNHVLKECMPEKDKDFNASEAFPLGNCNYFKKTMHNDVYEILPDGKLSIVYAWDFGDLNVDAEKLGKTQIQNVDEYKIFIEKMLASENINYVFTTWGCNSDYLHTQVIRKNKLINVLYNKNDRKISVFEKTKEDVHIYPMYWADDFVIGCIQENLRLAETDLEKIIPDAILDAESIEKKKQRNELDNPFLIKYYFKK